MALIYDTGRKYLWLSFSYMCSWNGKGLRLFSISLSPESLAPASLASSPSSGGRKFIPCDGARRHMYVSIQWDGSPKGRTRESVIKTAKVFNIQMVVQTDLIKVSFYKTVITRFERFIWYFFRDIRFRFAPIWYRKPNTFALIIPKLLKFVGVWELLSAMCHRRNVLISFHSSKRWFINLKMFSWCSTIGVLAGSFILWKKKFFEKKIILPK